MPATLINISAVKFFVKSFYNANVSNGMLHWDGMESYLLPQNQQSLLLHLLYRQILRVFPSYLS